MKADANDAARAAAVTVAHDAAQIWERVLGPRLAGFYLMGSLAHGGFSARYSDIDVGLIADNPLEPAECEAVKTEAAARSEALAGKLSLFWTDRTFSVGRFPPLDRIDFLDHAITVIERRRFAPERPTRTAVREYLDGKPRQNWSEQVAALSTMETLTAKDHKRYLRALLYPARYLYSWQTGEIASNDDAVAYVRSLAPAGLDVDLIGRALQCRQRGDDPDLLFAERAKLPGLQAACTAITGAQR